MLPADEGFGADRRTRAQPHNRLVQQDEFAGGYGLAQIVLQR